MKQRHTQTCSPCCRAASALANAAPIDTPRTHSCLPVPAVCHYCVPHLPSWPGLPFGDESPPRQFVLGGFLDVKADKGRARSGRMKPAHVLARGAGEARAPAMRGRFALAAFPAPLPRLLAAKRSWPGPSLRPASGRRKRPAAPARARGWLRTRRRPDVRYWRMRWRAYAGPGETARASCATCPGRTAPSTLPRSTSCAPTCGSTACVPATRARAARRRLR